MWTRRAVATADALVERFADAEGGGFFTTAADAEQLIVRTKDVFDGATPSANAVAALALARLGALTGDAGYTGHARRVVDLIGDLLTRHPTAFAHTVLDRRPARPRGHRGRGRPATGPTCWPRCVATGCPTPWWPGASRPTRRSGTAGSRVRLRVPGLQLPVPADRRGRPRRPVGAEVTASADLLDRAA